MEFISELETSTTMSPRIKDGLCKDARITDGLCSRQILEQEEAQIKEARIQDGLCGVEFPRITSQHNVHLGDQGTSQLLSGKRVSKAHPAALFFLSVEKLQQAIAECLTAHELYDTEVAEILMWLHEALFNLSSFAYLLGESTRHQLPVEFQEYLEVKSRQLSEEVGDAPDFVIFSAPSLLALNKIRVAVREAESAFCKWKESDEVTRHMLDHPHSIFPIMRHIKTLNRLSTLVFWWTRKQGLWLRATGSEVEEQQFEERYWHASTPHFRWSVHVD